MYKTCTESLYWSINECGCTFNDSFLVSLFPDADKSLSEPFRAWFPTANQHKGVIYTAIMHIMSLRLTKLMWHNPYIYSITRRTHARDARTHARTADARTHAHGTRTRTRTTTRHTPHAHTHTPTQININNQIN